MTSSPIRRIDQQLFAQVAADARRHPRLRLNHNFHREQDSVQRFLNVLQPGTYVRPLATGATVPAQASNVSWCCRAPSDCCCSTVKARFRSSCISAPRGPPTASKCRRSVPHPGSSGGRQRDFRAETGALPASSRQRLSLWLSPGGHNGGRQAGVAVARPSFKIRPDVRLHGSAASHPAVPLPVARSND